MSPFIAPSPPRTVARGLIGCIVISLVATGLLTQTGCLGLVANLAHAVGADKIPAEYKGLQSQKVAVITFSDASPFGEDRSARSLSDSVSEILSREVKGIELIRPETIDDWRDRNGWDQADFAEIGRGVGAAKVVGIELTGLRLREGPNLYRGHADVTVQVIDIESGNREFQKTLEDYTFPRNAAQDSAGISETKFRRLYLGMLARQITRAFHAFDIREDFALDSKFGTF